MSERAARIAVLGSLNTDLVIRCAHLPRPSETVIAESSCEMPGGKGANQAVAASRLGGDVAMIGRVGDDARGERLLESLRADNVDTTLVHVTAECSSGLAVVMVEQSGENSIVVLPGANAQLTRSDVAASANAIRECDVLLLQLEVPEETVRAAIELARRLNIPTILDPAPALKSTASGLLHVDLVCPNFAEAAVRLGRAIESIDEAMAAATAITQLGPSAAVITMGSQGAVVCENGNSQWIEPFEVDAVDTTAAGDAFAGALAVLWAEGATLHDAVRFACAAGASAATRHGAQPGMPTRSDVEAMLNT